VDSSLVDDLELLMEKLRQVIHATAEVDDEIASIHCHGLTQRGHTVSHPRYIACCESWIILCGQQAVDRGKQHPQRDAQFRYLYQQVKRCMRAKIPVISVVARAERCLQSRAGAASLHECPWA